MQYNKTDMAAWLFHQGTNFESYRYMGVHRERDENGAARLVFRVWAPNAEGVTVSGEFCGWSELPENAMTRVSEGGIWEAVLPDMPDGTAYKYVIKAGDGRRLWKSDPYGFSFEKPPATASRVHEPPESFAWHDEGWMRSRGSARDYARPLNIYEIHAGSWMRHEDGSVLSWDELGRELVPYVKRMGYTHVELLPVTEYPFDGSWGYQVTGYYAPTARYGSPEDFCAFVDTMHVAGIGVILDWVPAHFPKDESGLYEFDGRPLYECQGRDRMEHAGWGTRCFDVGRNEVESFLVSDAHFWADVYHCDGLRVDAVAAMIYLDFDRKPGEWLPNPDGSNINRDAVAFFRKLNGSMADRHPGVMMIAEESSSYAGVTSFDGEGLGFTYKWNMGWMNDALSYVSEDPIFRQYHHDKLTFPLCYAFAEKYVLPISHDEVVHGKKSLLDRNPGEYGQKFAGERAFHAYMMTQPGKKLSFMGNEIGQFREWDFAGSIEWFLLDYDSHRNVQRFFADMNNLYLESPELWRRDDSWSGFEWIDADNKNGNIISYLRTSDEGQLLVIVNFSPVYYPEFRVGVNGRSEWKELISSDDLRYGGGGVTHPKPVKSDDVPANGREESLCLRLPPLGALIFRKTKDLPKRRKGKKKANGKA